MRSGILRASAAASLLGFALACGGAEDTPEAAVRRTLAAIEQAAGAKDPGAMVEHVSADYADPQGNDRDAVRRIAAFHLLRNQRVHTLVRLREVEIVEPGWAEVDALVAMAGTAIPDAEVLATVRADLYRFSVSLREEEPGTWRVTSATWHPASRDDFR
jgi:hypothetical protein